MTAAPLDFTTLDDRAAPYYLALNHEPHALHVFPFCGPRVEAAGTPSPNVYVVSIKALAEWNDKERQTWGSPT